MEEVREIEERRRRIKWHENGKNDYKQNMGEITDGYEFRFKTIEL